MKYPCPICGDPNAYPFWVGDAPPEGCPQDMEWHRGEAPSIRSVTECSYQMRKAEQRAEWRRLAPDSFDDNGNILPGQLFVVLRAFSAAHPTDAVIL